MAEELSFVEVLMVTWNPGDKEYQDYLENEVDLFDGFWEDASEIIQEVREAQEENERREKEADENGDRVFTILSLGREPDTVFTKPLTGFSFRFFGQSFALEYSSGLEWEVYSLSASDVFDGCQDELKRLGMEVLEGKKAQGLDMRKLDNGKYIRFVTLWTYSSWQDSYSGEFDSEWDLVGIVNPYLVRKLIDDKITY